MSAATVVSTERGRVGHRVVGHGRPALLLTGFGASLADWDPRLLTTLAEHRGLVLVDNPGVGLSDPPERPAAISEFATTIAASLDALLTTPEGRRSVDVIGWSMGGMIAQALAVIRPDLVRSLVLAASAPGVGGALGPTPIGLHALGGDPGALMEALFPGDPESARAYVRATSAGRPREPIAAEALAAQVEAVRTWRAGDDPAGRATVDLTVPVLLVDGMRDPISPATDADALALVFPHARRATSRVGGHGVLFVDPARVAHTINDFWEAIA